MQEGKVAIVVDPEVPLGWGRVSSASATGNEQDQQQGADQMPQASPFGKKGHH